MFQTSISVKQVDSVITLNFKLLTKDVADPSVRGLRRGSSTVRLLEL